MVLQRGDRLVYWSRARMGRFLRFHRNRASGVVEWDWENMPIDWRTEWLSVDGTRTGDVRELLSKKSEWQASTCEVSSAPSDNACALTDHHVPANDPCKR
jgi:hypothetical protein